MNSILVSQIILLPILLLLTAGYWFIKPESVSRSRILAYDILIIVLGILACVVSYQWMSGQYHEDKSAIWLPVLSVVITFHVYPLVLLIGWFLRKRWFK